MKKFLYLLLFVPVLVTKAQQLNLTNMYYYNTYLVNPAAAGENGCFNAFLGHRSQWTAMQDRPVNNWLTLDAGFGNHGVGVNARLGSIGLFQSTQVAADYAYHIKLTDKYKLSAGVGLGYVQNRFNGKDAIATDYSDQILQPGNQTQGGLVTKLGLMLTSQRFRIGISMPQFAASQSNFNSATTDNNFGIEEKVNVFGDLVLLRTVNSQWNAFAFYKNSDYGTNQVDIGTRWQWQNTVGVGALYRSEYGLSAMIDLCLKEKLTVAYSFDLTAISNEVKPGNTHEFMIGFKLCRSKASPAEESEETGNMYPTQELTPETEEETIVQQDSATTPARKKGINIDSLNQLFKQEDKMMRYALNSSSKVVSDNQKAVVNQVVTILEENPELNITVEGNTCNIGKESYNQDIALERAQDIAKAIKSAGISPERIKTHSNGEQNPLNGNNTNEERLQNRRVQIRFYY